MKATVLSFYAVMGLSIVIFCSCNNDTNKPDQSATSLTPVDSTDIVEGVSDNDREFVAKAASGGIMEVELGKLAQQNGKNQRVKAYGAMLERDHSKANEELKSLATTKNIQIPKSMSDHHRQMVEDMKKKKGDEFDKSYIGMMVSDHNKDIESFKSQSNYGNESELKAFASKTLPVLQMHLDSAEAIHKNLK